MIIYKIKDDFIKIKKMIFIICNNKNSIYYGHTKDYIIKEMQKTNYDFDSWCNRAPAMWIYYDDTNYDYDCDNLMY